MGYLQETIFVLPFLAKLGQKSQNCLLRMKFGISANSNMLNLMFDGDVHFFWTESTLLGKFDPKNKNCLR